MKLTRIATLLLVATMLLPTLFSCGGGSTPTPGGTTTAGTTTAGTTQAFWETLDYTGTTIKYHMPQTGNAEGDSKYIIGPDAIGADSVLNKIYDRNLAATAALGLKVDFDYIPKDTTMSAYTTQLVLGNSADAPDLVVGPTVDLVSSILLGHLCNLISEDEESYFDFDKPEWYKEFMESTTLSSTSMHIMAGDYFLGIIQSATALFLNVDMYNDLYPDTKIEGLYDKIQAGQWFYDDLSTLVEAAYKPGATADETLYGWSSRTTGWTAGPFAYSAFELYERQADGSLTYGFDHAEVELLVSKLVALYKSPGFYWEQLGTVPETVFLNGRALIFGSYANLGRFETEEFQNMDDDVTVIPYPRLTEEKEYVTPTQGGLGGSILYSTTKFAEASAYIQYCVEHSADILVTYYEEALKFKYSTDPGTAAMLDILRAGMSNPTSYLWENKMHAEPAPYKDANAFHVFVGEACRGTQAFASYWASFGELKANALRDYCTTYQILDKVQ